MLGRFTIFISAFLFICDTQAIEFNGAHYDVFVGDVNGDGIDDVYLKVPDSFVLIHGDISVPLIIDSDVPSYLVASQDAESPLFLNPVIDESIDVSLLTQSNDIAFLNDTNGDGIPDLEISSGGKLLYSFVLDGAASTPVIAAVDIPVPNLDVSAVDPADEAYLDNDFNGIIQSNVDAGNDGALNITIPIDVLPGINGMQPSIAFSYNSRSENGYLGWGWRLDGISEISRCRSNSGKDGYSSSILRHDKFKFCLNGERLIQVSEREYRTESESFVRITNYGGTLRAPDYWKIEYPAGRVAIFDAKQYDGLVVDLDRAPRRWNVSRLEDASGNYMSYSYFSSVPTLSGQFGSGRVYYISRIRYGRNGSVNLNKSVRFYYESREDIRQFYVGGEFVRVDQRLSSIELIQAGSSKFKYNLSYVSQAPSNVPQVSKLSSIEKCALMSSGDKCGPVKKIKWNTETDMLEQESKASYSYYGLGDFDGDGNLDTLDIERSGASWIIKKTSFSDPDATPKTWLTTTQDLSIRPTIMDINADGLDDVVFTDALRKDNHHLNVKVLRSSGRHFIYEVWADPVAHFGSQENYSKQLMDVNGDNLPDLLLFHWKLGIHVRLNTGRNGFSSWKQWYLPYSGAWGAQFLKNSGTTEFSDLNGDGLTDLVFCAGFYCGIDSSGANATRVLINKGDHFQLDESWVSRSGISGLARVADVNGDGLSDWLSFDEDAVYVQLSTGSGFLGTEVWATHVERFLDIGGVDFEVTDGNGGTRIYGGFISAFTFNDVNNDGCSDIIMSGVGKAIYVSFSTCSPNEGFTEFALLVEEPGRILPLEELPQDHLLTGVIIRPGGHNSVWDRIPISAIDVDGDGVLEIVDSKFYRKTSIEPRLVEAVEDYYSMSDTSNSQNRIGYVDISYSPFFDSDAYRGRLGYPDVSQDRDGSYPIRNVRKGVSMMLVSGLRQNGQNSLTYSYENYRADTDGWGFLGFEKITVVEDLGLPKELKGLASPTNNIFFYLLNREYIKTETFYNQLASNDYSLASTPKRVDVYAAKGTTEKLVSRADHRWKVRVYDDDLDKTAEENIVYDANSTPIQVTPGYSSPHYFSYLYESTTERWGLDGHKLNTSIVGDASASLSQCPSSANKPGVIKAHSGILQNDLDEALGSTADIDYSPQGLRLFSREISCDNLNTESSAIYSALKVLEYAERTSDGDWLVRLPNKTEHRAFVGESDIADLDVGSVSRTTGYQYNSLGLLEVEIIEPDNLGLGWSSTYTYNEYGSKTNVVQSWTGKSNDGLTYGNTRSTSTTETYTDSGELLVDSVNALNQSYSTTLDAVFGLPSRAVDLNGLVLVSNYDAWGRSVDESGTIGSISSRKYKECRECFVYNDDAIWYLSEKLAGQSALTSYFDIYGRKVGSRSKSPEGRYIYTFTLYDERGQVSYKSNPFFAGDTQYVEDYYYDALGRLRKTVLADGTESLIEYSGLTEHYTNQEGQTASITKNAAGWDVAVEDAKGTELKYTYTNFGDLRSTEIVGNSSTKMTNNYDLLGRKTSIDDPDAGLLVVEVNSLGLTSKTIDANGIETEYIYDQLDRIVQRTDDASSPTALRHSWIYDSSANGIGKLESLEGVDSEGNRYSERYEYNAFATPRFKYVEIDGVEYKTTTHYDALRRVIGTTYPTGFTVKNRFNEFGFLYRMEKINGDVLWESLESDAIGNTTEYSLGNNVVTTKNFDQSTNNVESIFSRVNGSVVQNHEYEFSPIGNLISRTDHIASVQESFCYDELNRLKASRIGVCTTGDSDYSYDSLGNITGKQSVTDYKYLSGRPHAVSFAGGSSYQYDSAGQMISGGGRMISYTAFGKPSYISKNTSWSAIIYDANHNRIKRSDSSGKETTYVGLGVYEINRDGENTQHIHNVGDFAQYIIKSGEINDDYYVYLHRDHLNSVVAKTGDDPLLVSSTAEFYSYDPWGRRLDSDWVGEILPETYLPYLDSRGYSGHEHIDGVGLIHMNGRVYDPVLGRFLAADSFVQDLRNTQSFNRYSYVLNAPLSNVDPSGYLDQSHRYRAAEKWAGYDSDVLLDAQVKGFKTGIYAIVDMVPVLGDAKGVYEFTQAPSLLGTGVLAISFLPFGDAVKWFRGGAGSVPNSAPAPGSIRFMDETDNFVEFSSKRSDIDPNGSLDIVAHGTPNKIQIMTENGEVWVDHRVAAKLIKQRQDYNGQSIRLLSCNTGSCDTGFAQNLSNQLGVKVEAPTNLLWAYPDGSMKIAPRRSLDPNSQLFSQPKLREQGEFRIFEPAGNKQ